MGFRVDGLSDLILGFRELAELPGEVIDEMLNAEADVVVEAQKRTARSMLTGQYNAGVVSGAVAKNKRVQLARGGGKVLFINFPGKVYGKGRPKGGNRIAEIAFVNEFGKENQPARPFIRAANEQSADEAAKKARDVYDNFLTSKGF